MITFKAVFFDGQVAADREVSASFMDQGVSFSGAGVPVSIWPYAGLDAVDPPVAGRPLRLSSDNAPGARLVIADEAAKGEFLARAKHLKGGFHFGRLARVLGWIGAGLIGAGLATYLVVQYAPKPLAFLLPDEWRNRLGVQIEKTLTEGARICSNAGGQQALSAMFARIAEGDPDLPPVQIRVYDIPIMNAFAMPGERVVITAELIDRAETPEEVAGVLAHELGHVVNRHSETQLVRLTGMQILFAIVTGGGGGDTLSQFAGLAAILRYSRAAEAEADDFAVTTMVAAAIDPLGLKSFFQKVMKEQAGPGGGKFGKIESVFATHPGTEDRINKIMPLPAGVTARPVMTPEQWRALKAICGKT